MCLRIYVSDGGPVRLSPVSRSGDHFLVSPGMTTGAPPFGGRPLVWLDPSYLISSKIRNVGRYRAMTMAPTAPPTTAIMTGSINEVRDSTAAVTSSS
jgi:hypothetical protein